MSIKRILCSRSEWDLLEIAVVGCIGVFSLLGGTASVLFREKNYEFMSVYIPARDHFLTAVIRTYGDTPLFFPSLTRFILSSTQTAPLCVGYLGGRPRRACGFAAQLHSAPHHGQGRELRRESPPTRKNGPEDGGE